MILFDSLPEQVTLWLMIIPVSQREREREAAINLLTQLARVRFPVFLLGKLFRYRPVRAQRKSGQCKKT